MVFRNTTELARKSAGRNLALSKHGLNAAVGQGNRQLFDSLGLQRRWLRVDKVNDLHCEFRPTIEFPITRMRLQAVEWEVLRTKQVDRVRSVGSNTEQPSSGSARQRRTEVVKQ